VSGNPYGRSRLIIEDMLRDLPAADALNTSATYNTNDWSVTLLRYLRRPERATQQPDTIYYPDRRRLQSNTVYFWQRLRYR
jgi:hypothetical protein